MKNLAKFAVQRPITTMMMALIIIGFGIYGLMRLRLNLYPDVSFPTITIYTTYEGVAPEDIETLITRPIEEQVGSISGIERMRSLSSQGASVIKLYFKWGTDLYVAESDVRKKLEFVRNTLPRDADQPIVYEYDPNQEPIIILTLTSKTRSLRQLRTYSTEQLEQRFERLTGIASAETSGGLERQINIWLSNEDMRAYNIDLSEVANKLQQENIQVPAGELIAPRQVYSLRTIGKFKDIDQIRNTVIAMVDGKPIRLKDIAKVQDGIAQPIGGVHVQGTPGVIIKLYKQSDANVVTAANNVRRSLSAIQQTLPKDMHLKVLLDKSGFIKLSIHDLYRTGIEAVVLVVLILLFFLNSGRSAFIIAVSIPVSIIATFAIMNYFNVSLNVISLSGLALAVGMVVDDAVVVLENIFHFREDGYKGKKASVLGAQEVAVPVIVSTLTTLVVFIPILFVPGIAGFLFRDLALTISFALAVSFFVALSIIPVLSSKLFASQDEEEGARPDDGSHFRRLLRWSHKKLWRRMVLLPAFIGLILIYPFIWIYRGIRKMAAAFGRFAGPTVKGWHDRMDRAYHRGLERAVSHSGVTIAAATIFFLITLPIYTQLGGTFFPEVDQNEIILQVERKPGVNLFELERTISQVEAIIRKNVPEATLVVSDYGDKKGIEGADNPGGYRGEVRIELVPSGQRKRSQSDITADLLNRLKIVPGAQIKEIRDDPLNPEGENGLIVYVYGYGQRQRALLSDEVKKIMQEIPGVVNAYSSADQGRPELLVSMDRERISRVGLTTSSVANALGNAVKGDLATTYLDKSNEYNILVQLAPTEKSSVQELKNLQIKTGTGTWVPLSSLAEVQEYQGPTNILRLNQERATEIKADLQGTDLKTATREVKARLQQLSWPEGYRFEIGGTAEDQAQSFNYLMIAFLIASVLTYMVMASQFESLVEPFIIFFTIPLALSGVLIILWLTHTPISVTSMVGLILLSGIVVKNGVVMLDYIKILQVRGLPREKAIVNGAGRRLRPILITAGTTTLSMVPLAIGIGSGSETWSPMARTVIGGLIMSTLLMLFVVPCLYKVFNEMIERLGFDPIHKLDPLEEELKARNETQN